MDIIEKIYKLKEARNWSNNYLAMEADISHTTVNGWFSRRNTTPSLDAIINICDAFGITPAEFFNETNQRIELSPQQSELLDQWDLLSKETKLSFIECLKAINRERSQI